jgi:hydroxymethylpyrimidine pyrophosphatase-like HAD family hydrolase
VKQQNNAIIFTTQQETFSFPAATIKKQNFYYPPVHVTQTFQKLQDNHIIVYEKATCNGGYVFDKSVEFLFYKIFKPSQSSNIYTYANLYFYTATVDGKDINLIIYNQNKKQLHFIYPLPKEIFLTLLNKMIKNKQHFQLNNYATYSLENIVLSKFSPKSVILDGLVKRTSGHTRK